MREAMRPDLIVFEDIEELTTSAARLFAALCAVEVEEKGFFAAVLSGGSTPKGLLKKLASARFREKVRWDRVHLFWGDERDVPPDDEESNYGMAARELIAKVPIPLENLHRMQVELGPIEAARGYEAEVRAFFSGRRTTPPEFDLVFLGLGTDGHTLSLFPGTKAVSEDGGERLVIENYVGSHSCWRVTMTPALVNNAKVCVFMATGAQKREAVKEVFERGSTALPAGLIRPARGRLLWLVDRGAASGLRQFRK